MRRGPRRLGDLLVGVVPADVVEHVHDVRVAAPAHRVEQRRLLAGRHGLAECGRQLAADGGPGERMLAVAAVTRIGAAAGPAWRDSLDGPEVRAYAKMALAGAIADGAGGLDGRGGADLPPDLQPLPDDLAWVATDMLALACDDDFPDADELAAAFREAVPAGQEAALFDAMGRGTHPDVVDVLNHVGKYHPDKQVAKAARTAAHRALSRRGSHS